MNQVLEFLAENYIYVAGGSFILIIILILIIIIGNKKGKKMSTSNIPNTLQGDNISEISSIGVSGSSSPVEPVTPAINPVVEPVSPVKPVEQNGVEQSNISMANNVNNSGDLSQKKDNDSLEVFGLD